MPAAAPIQVSVVDFLNAAPLAWGLLRGHFGDRFTVSRDVPAVCAEKLRSGAADVGLVPSIAYQTIPGLSLLPDLCIAADGEVRSVLLLTRRPLARVRTVAADPASRTSVALVRVLFGEMHGTQPEMVDVPGEPRRLLDRFDAVLAIGDRALRARTRGLHVHDLAALWKRHTGLPFVFAVWAVAPGVDLGPSARLFAFSRALGEGDLDGIVAASRRKLRLSAPALRRYFTEQLSYHLGPREIEGMARFFALAERHGVIRRARKLRFYRDATLPRP